MALTPFRWIALAAIGCMFVFFSLVELRTRDEPEYTLRSTNGSEDPVEAALESKVSAAQQGAEYLARNYRLLQIIDSVQRIVSRAPDTGSLRVFIDGTYPPRFRGLMEAMIRRARVLKPGTSVGIDVIAVQDAATGVRGVWRFPISQIEVRYELPSRAGQRCRVYLRSGPPTASMERELRGQAAAEQVLGPCAFYSAFGEPGPRVREWLVAGGWGYTTEGSWTSTPESRQYFGGYYEPGDLFRGTPRALSYLGIEAGGPACMVGDLSECERVAQIIKQTRRMKPVGPYTAGLSLGRYRYFPMGLGTFAGELLSDMVSDIGRERFKAFWTSPDSVPKAYATAAGKSWGQAVREWLISKYGRIERGPRVTSYALLMSLVLVVGALGLVMRTSTTRRFA